MELFTFENVVGPRESNKLLLQLGPMSECGWVCSYVLCRYVL